MADKLTDLFRYEWTKEAIPQEFKNVSIIHLYKRKGHPKVCDNHRCISLLSIAGQVLARVKLNRLNMHFNQARLIPGSQCGFRKDRRAIDMILQQDNYRRNVKNKMRTSTSPLSTLQKHSTVLVALGFGTLWQSLCVR